MTENSNPAKRPAQSGAILGRFIFFGVLGAMLFAQLFITFKGLSSPAGMDQAQIARELARGNGFQTKVVRPYAWREYIDNGKGESVVGQQDIFQPPLPSVILAPAFKALQSRWEFSSSSSIYLLDRVVAGISLLFYLGAMGFTWLVVIRLFDSHIANWTVVMMMACQLLWNVALSGLAPMLVLFFFSVALYLLTVALDRSEAGAPGTVFLMVGVGVMATLMLLSHWLAISLVVGLVVSTALMMKPRTLSLLILVPASCAALGWGLRNQMVSGEFLGAAKATLQSTLTRLPDSWLLRDFAASGPYVDMMLLTRKVLENFNITLHDLYSHLGGVLPAMFFFLCLLHPFKRNVTSNVRWVLAITWLCAAVGMAMIGLPDKENDENQLHVIFIPLFCAFGLAFLAVLWGRLGFGRMNWWSKNGAVFVAFLITALPMIAKLPLDILFGLTAKNRFSHWPPYSPDRFSRLSAITDKNEILFSDVPWAIAWYADRTSIWLPIKQEQFSQMEALLKKDSQPIGGLVLTPYSAKSTKLGDVFADDNEYREWAPQILRGITAGLGVDSMANSDFVYKQSIPLVGKSVGDGRIITESVFMSEKRR